MAEQLKNSLGLPKPTPEMLAYQDMEVGYFFHWDIEVFDNSFTFFEDGQPLPDVKCWNPKSVDTDQWLQAAVAGGAKFALLTAKHSTGFCLWPTKVHDYHVGNSPGGVDVIGSFVKSCRKYGVVPGIYYSLGSKYFSRNYTKADGTEDRERINEALLAQLEELLTWYGPINEIWFDGGVLRPELGGPAIPAFLERVAPNLICFGGPPGVKNVLRWSGSEQGVAVADCYSTARWLTDPERRNVTCDSPGGPNDPVWAPVEVDMPGRDIFTSWHEGWMYKPGEEAATYSGDYLFERYLTSVGRNANLLVGALPNTDGVISADQTDAMKTLGGRLKETFGTPLAKSSGMLPDGTVEMRFDEPVDIEYVEMMEDQAEGQNILGWEVELLWPKRWGEKWFQYEKGRSIGHKRILRTGLIRTMGIRLRITEARGAPAVRSFSVYGKKAYR